MVTSGLRRAVADGGVTSAHCRSHPPPASARADARIGRVALVVVADRLARMGEEDGVAIAAARLQALES